jgi:ABC-type uncharacterized transport system auxiliary subunit
VTLNGTGRGSPMVRGPVSGIASRRHVSAGAMVLVALVLSGCSAFRSEVDPVMTYTLGGAASPSVPFDGSPCCVLEVRTPLPAPGFATVRMLYQRTEFQHEAYAYAQWVDTLPMLVRSSIIARLDRLGRFEAVVAAPSPEPPQFRLETRELMVLHRFEGDSSEVEVSLRARLIDAEKRELIGARPFSSTVSAAPTAQGGVAAANEALDNVLTELSRYLLDALGS